MISRLSIAPIVGGGFLEGASPSLIFYHKSSLQLEVVVVMVVMVVVVVVVVILGANVGNGKKATTKVPAATSSTGRANPLEAKATSAQ